MWPTPAWCGYKPGQQRGAGGTAAGRVVELGEAEAVLRQRIEVRRLDLPAASSRDRRTRCRRTGSAGCWASPAAGLDSAPRNRKSKKRSISCWLKVREQLFDDPIARCLETGSTEIVADAHPEAAACRTRAEPFAAWQKFRGARKLTLVLSPGSEARLYSSSCAGVAEFSEKKSP